MRLNKPYTNQQRADFIVEANNLGYVVTEYATYLEALPVVKSLEEVKISKMSDINTISSQEIIAGFWWDTPNNGRLHFSYDEFDQLNIQSALQGANMALADVPNVPKTIEWNGYSDIEHLNLVEVTFTALEVIQFWSASETHKGVIMGKAKTLKEQVSAITEDTPENRADLEKIKW